MPERSFVGVFLGIGAGVGAAVGIAFDNLALGIGPGIGLGLLIGLALDRRDARRHGGDGTSGASDIEGARGDDHGGCSNGGDGD